MLDASSESLLADCQPSRLGKFIGRLLAIIYSLTGKAKYDNYRLERILGLSIVVTPTVANPKALRTGAFFASQLNAELIGPDACVLDMGTGSGVCALAAARFAKRVVATDINPAAVRCAHANALMNRLDEHIEFLEGDLFAPIVGEQFDLVLFNPPFLVGVPKDARDAAWRSSDVAERFAAGLSDHLKAGGAGLLLLSSFGDACAVFERELRRYEFHLEVYARRRFINETVTVLKAMRRNAEVITG